MTCLERKDLAFNPCAGSVLVSVNDEDEDREAQQTVTKSDATKHTAQSCGLPCIMPTNTECNCIHTLTLLLD